MRPVGTKGRRHEATGYRGPLRRRSAPGFRERSRRASDHLRRRGDRNGPRARGSLIPGVTALSGEERSRGIELEFAGEVASGLELFGGYAFIDTETTEGDEFTTGKDLFDAPRHRASLLASYTFDEGMLENFGGGAGVFYTGESFADQIESVKLDDYLTVDAALWYRPDAGIIDVAPRLGPSIQVGVKNLFDEDYFLGGNGFNSVTPGTPRTFYASANARF